MTGKQIVITGATNGIGLAAAEALAARGDNIVIVGRNETRTKIAAARIRAAAGKGATVGTLIADLASQDAVRNLAAEVRRSRPRWRDRAARRANTPLVSTSCEAFRPCHSCE